MNMSSFVEQDYNILKKHYDVITYNYTKKTGKEKYLRFLLKNRNNFDICYAWFGDLHATMSVAFCRLFRKKSIVTIGGYDTKYIPELKYGFLSKPQRYLYAWLHFTFADRIISCAESLLENLRQNVKVSPKTISTIYMGIDDNYWRMEGAKQGNTVLTVAVVNEMWRARLKGITTLLDAAKEMPDVKFEVIGIGEPAYSEISRAKSPNVSIYGLMNRAQLLEKYRGARVYAQLSMSEALGNALCEAMSCECVPIATREGDMPLVIGDSGFFVEYGNVGGTMRAIQEALQAPNGRLARERVLAMMSPKRRESALVKVIDGLFA